MKWSFKVNLDDIFLLESLETLGFRGGLRVSSLRDRRSCSTSGRSSRIERELGGLGNQIGRGVVLFNEGLHVVESTRRQPFEQSDVVDIVFGVAVFRLDVVLEGQLYEARSRGDHGRHNLHELSGRNFASLPPGADVVVEGVMQKHFVKVDSTAGSQ